MNERVVITSAGVISPLGLSLHEMRNTLFHSFPEMELFQEQWVTPVQDFDFSAFIPRFKNRRYLNRGAMMSIAAAAQCVSDSGLSFGDFKEAGLFLGTGPHMDITEFSETSPLWMLKHLPNTPLSAISQITGARGENMTVCSACSASLQAIGEAYRRIKDGYITMALAGGGDSRLNPGGLDGYSQAGALFKGTDPSDYLPGVNNPGGFIPGEGGAVFLLETLSSAEKRGASILGEITGFGLSVDGLSMTAPDPEGVRAEAAVRQAIKSAGIFPEDLGLLSLHGTGTSLNDAMERKLFERIFREEKPVRVAFKQWMGHLSAACGAVELACVLGCFHEDSWPRGNRKTGIIERKPLKGKFAMLENFGFGGQNCALVVKK